MATNSSRLNLTRDQLAGFLTDHQQIKQFEMLFSAVDAIAPNVVLEINIAVGTAQATANNAIDQIIALGQDMAVNDAAMSAKVHQAMDAIPRLAQALELLAAAPVAQAQMPLFDDLTPRAELGTMAAQNAEKVAITGGTIAGISFGGFPAGTVSLPSLYWGTDTATGFYRIGANNIGYSYNGTKLLDLSATLLGVTGGVSVTTQFTSSVATGTPPLVVASTTNVANLNASSLGGATFAAPGAIGGSTPGTGSFTTLTANTVHTSKGNSGSLPDATATTIFTAGLGFYTVAVRLPAGVGDATNWMAAANVYCDGTASRIIANNTAVLVLSLSGNNVQVWQNSGGTQAGGVEYSYILQKLD